MIALVTTIVSNVVVIHGSDGRVYKHCPATLQTVVEPEMETVSLLQTTPTIRTDSWSRGNTIVQSWVSLRPLFHKAVR